MTLVLFADAMVAHDPGRGHPERPERLVAVRDALRAALIDGVQWAQPAPAWREHLLRVHEPAHVELLMELRGRTHHYDPETIVGPASVDAALVAAGAAVEAVQAVTEGRARSAFALVRPPGHHAEAGRTMGFCLLNNVAIGAAHAIAACGRRRVLIVDWDVHHGNGTQAIFYERSDVLLFSAHQWPLYPGTGWWAETGDGPGRGFTVNAPLPAGLGDDEYGAVFESLLVPIADAWKPDLVMVSAGFDAHADDPLGGMRVTTEGFTALLDIVNGIADRHAGGRLILVLEGGYDLAALAGSIVACTRRLAAGDRAAPHVTPRWESSHFEALLAIHQRYWPSIA